MVSTLLLLASSGAQVASAVAPVKRSGRFCLNLDLKKTKEKKQEQQADVTNLSLLTRLSVFFFWLQRTNWGGHLKNRQKGEEEEVIAHTPADTEIYTYCHHQAVFIHTHTYLYIFKRL